MKKKLSLLLVLVLIVATVLSGCGGNDTTELKMATGGTGGTDHPINTANYTSQQTALNAGTVTR